MPKRPLESTANRFSIVDLAIDILLLATTFAIPSRFPNFLSSGEQGFFKSLLQTAALFVGYFGFGLYVAHMYSSTAIRIDSRWTHKVLFPSGPLLFFTCLLVINVLFSAYNIFQMIAPPMLTSLLIIIEALAFGFTFGLDFAIERHRALDPKHTVPPDNEFSQSLTSVPYVLLTVLVLFPGDYFSLEFRIPLLGRLITILGIGAIIYFLGNVLNKGIFGRLRIRANMNPATIVIVSFLMVLGFMGFDVLEVFARDHVSIINSSGAAKIVYLFFFGIVPIRIGSILFSKTNLFNRLLGFLAVLSYVLVGTGLIDLGWNT